MKIIKPTIGGHDGSSFRELIDLWQEKGFCEVVHNKNTNQAFSNQPSLDPSARPWAGSEGDILLYDNPILDKLHSDLKWNMALFANQVYQGKNCYPWTFWPKHPKMHEQATQSGILNYDDRKINSVFIGSMTTNDRIKQASWKNVIEKFHLTPPGTSFCDHKQYLQILKNSKFGLCLPGVGPKCLREMELMGFGTVPIFTPGVSTNYYNELREGVHFLFANNPKEIPLILNSCTKEKWLFLSKNCIKWFNENASPKGSFEVTRKIIEENYE